jgi:hypothetical protein
MDQILSEASQAFVNVVERVGVGEAQVALAVGPKVDARGDGDLGVL